MEKLQKALAGIDAYNSQDPNLVEEEDGRAITKEQLYAQRMSQVLLSFHPEASIPLQIAARAQHIGRWEIPRSEYSLDRRGYLRWRNALKIHHADLVGQILGDLQLDSEVIERVKFLVQKKSLKNDVETQVLEDVICLVFLQFYASEFIESKPQAKIIDILKKTWRKMSNAGQQAALDLTLDDHLIDLIKQAISESK